MMDSQFKYWISILRKEHGLFGVYMFYIVHILMILFIILGIILEVKMKAILVIDMPKECCECPCFYDYLHCQAKDGVNVLGDERPNDCPLKPMPERIPTNEYGYMTPYGSVWNACIDEILGDCK